MSLNRVVLVGHLTRDPELKYSTQSVPIASMGIAVNRFTKNELTGDYEVDFFNIVAFRRTAEFAANYLTKGRLVSIDGRLQTRSWVDQTGQKRTVFEIIAENIQGLDRKGDTTPSAAGSEIAEPDTNGSYQSAPAAAPVSSPHVAQPQAARRAPAPAPVDDGDEPDPFADE